MEEKETVVTIDGQKVLVKYTKPATGISLQKTSNAETGNVIWLNLNQQKQAKSQIAAI